MISLAGLGLSGCEKTIPTITMQKESKELNQEPQYSVKRVAVFADDLAMYNKRGIYEITDEQTRKRYLGVSGIGITEIGVIQSEHVRQELER